MKMRLAVSQRIIHAHMLMLVEGSPRQCPHHTYNSSIRIHSHVRSPRVRVVLSSSSSLLIFCDWGVGHAQALSSVGVGVVVLCILHGSCTGSHRVVMMLSLLLFSVLCVGRAQALIAPMATARQQRAPSSSAGIAEEVYVSVTAYSREVG